MPFDLEDGSGRLLEEDGTVLLLENDPALYAWQAARSKIRNRGPLGYRHGSRVRMRTAEPVPPQFPIFIQPENKYLRTSRGMRPRQVKHTETVLPQFNPPFPFAEIKQPRGVAHGMKPRKGFITFVVPPQLNPPYTFDPIKQDRQLRGTKSRISKKSEVVPTQQTAPVAIFVPQGQRRSRLVVEVKYRIARTILSPEQLPQPSKRSRFVLRNLRHAIETVRPQVNPPFPFSAIKQPRTARDFLARRGKSDEPVWPQQAAAANPPITFVIKQVRVLRGALPRQVKHAETVRPQVNPPYPFNEVVQRRSLRVVRRWGRIVTGVPQAAPIDEIRQPRSTRGMKPRQVKHTETVRAQLNPPFPFAEVKFTRVARGFLSRRGKLWEFAPNQQAAAPAPPMTFQFVKRAKPPLWNIRRRADRGRSTLVDLIHKPTRQIRPPKERVKRIERTVRQQHEPVRSQSIHRVTEAVRKQPKSQMPLKTPPPVIAPDVMRTRRPRRAWLRRIQRVIDYGWMKGASRPAPTGEEFELGAPRSRYNLSHMTERYEIGDPRSRYVTPPE